MDDRLKKIRFRAWRRGFREMDLLMGGFADLYISTMTEAELAAFESLLGEADQDVYDWILGRADVPLPHDGPLLARLRDFRHGAPQP